MKRPILLKINFVCIKILLKLLLIFLQFKKKILEIAKAICQVWLKTAENFLFTFLNEMGR